MALRVRRIARLVLAAAIAVGGAFAIHLITTGGVNTSAWSPGHSRARARAPRTGVAVQRLPLRAAREQGAPVQGMFYSLEFVGDVPVPGGYSGVANNLGVASSGARLRNEPRTQARILEQP